MVDNKDVDLYLRLSQRADEEKVMSLDEQEKLLRRQAKQHGLKVRRVHRDDGITGFSDDPSARPGFVSLCMAIDSGEIGYIGVTRLDRFARDSGVTNYLLAKCAKHGVKMLKDGSISDPSSSAAARAMAQIEGVMGEMESRIKSERIKDARRAGAENRRPHPGPRPFGYLKDRRTLDPIEAPAYRELFERVIAGEGVQRIAFDWESRGILNRKGNRWDAKSLRVLLSAPRAIGMRQHRGEIIGPGDWEPIVTAETQRAAIAATTSRRTLRTATGGVRQARLLSSLVTCAQCGESMRVRYSNHRTTPAQYACDASKGRCCGKTYAKAEAVEAEVERRFLARLSDPETVAAIAQLEDSRPDVGEMLGTVELLESEIHALAADYGAGDIERAVWQVAHKGKQKCLEAARERLSQAMDVPTLLTISPSETVAGWDAYGLDEKRRRLAAFIDTIDVRSAGGVARKRSFDPERVHVTWRI